MNTRLRNLLIGIAATISVLGVTAGSCKAPTCPQGTFWDAEDGECEQIEQGDDD